jgi:hypothetical protein
VFQGEQKIGSAVGVAGCPENFIFIGLERVQ